MIPKTDRTQIAFDILWEAAERIVREKLHEINKTDMEKKQENHVDKEKYNEVVPSSPSDNSVSVDMMIETISPEVASISSFPEIMTVDQMKEYLQISRPTAYELIHQKHFPTFRIGNAVRISKKLLDQWIFDETKKKDEKY